MAYEPATAKLTRWILAFLCGTISLPICIMAVFAISMQLNWHDVIRSRLPAALEPGYFCTGDEGSPIGLVRFSIGRNAASAIQAEGKAFLDREAGPGWQPTPLPIEKFRPGSDCSGFWCSRSDVAGEATRWVSKPGSFVLLSMETNNSLAMVVNPAERAVIFGYYVD